MSSDDSAKRREAGMKLMFLLGGFTLLIFLLGIAVIWYLSYGP